MKFDISEVSHLIKEEIKRYRTEIDVAMVGRVLEVGDGIARVCGLDNAMAGEMLEFEDGVIGEVFNLEEESVGAVIYGDYQKVKESTQVRSTGKMLTVPVGSQMLGRVVDPLCKPIDGKGQITGEDTRAVEFPAAGIAQRQPVSTPLSTGLKSVDSMIPIGRGQRIDYQGEPHRVYHLHRHAHDILTQTQPVNISQRIWLQESCCVCVVCSVAVVH